MANTETGWTNPNRKPVRKHSRRPRPMPAFPDKEIARFWALVEKCDGCWKWLGGFDHKGYAVFTYNYKNYHASRIVWFLSKNSDPAPLLVCHECDNPPCVNPEHLFLGTDGDNHDDKVRKGREPQAAIAALRRYNETKSEQTHCKRGHLYSPENTYRSPQKPNSRVCRTCRAARTTKRKGQRERVRVEASRYRAMTEQLSELRKLVRDYFTIDPAGDVAGWCEASNRLMKLVGLNPSHSQEEKETR